MIGDYFKYALDAIFHKGIRSWLTMLGIFVGIATIVSLISLGQGLDASMRQQFAMMGSNIIMVMPGSGFSASGAGPSASTLNVEDKKVIESVRGVELAGRMITMITLSKYKGESKFNFVSGIPTDSAQKIIEDMQQVRVKEGRVFNPNDRYAAIIGSRVADGKFFARKVGVGDELEIDGRNFKIVGTLDPMGSQQDDESAYIPLKTAEELFDTTNYLVIMARAKDNYNPDDVAEGIKEKLRKHRNVKKGEEDFTVQTSQELLDSVSVILSAVQWFLIGIAGISLLVGGIGIMNTMYTSVMERTREIGVMKAIGAKNSDITLLFLIESGVVGTAGGLVGCALGIGLSKTVEFIASKTLADSTMLKADISLPLVVGALLVSFIVGCLSGVLPAQQAAGLKPVDALRYE
ncbi:MAG: ABC transporter permease [Candidatus Altiarchaeota archaeon]|nr:ABC transporter permease [Candidatus Altiarchaeota archaeon]